jgi:Zn-dependent protease
MFQNFNFRLGTLFGFPIKVNLSFLLLLAAVFFWMGGAQGLVIALITAGSVLLHELGHALVARRLGVPVVGIELHFFGGAAQMNGMPRTPNDEILVAGAGPAVSFALAGIGYGSAAITGAPVLALFAVINLVLGAFNLLPAFPSDGGRILRAWLARRRGLVAATDLAVRVGRWVCLTMALTGLFVGSFQLVLVAGVLWMMGGSERLAARVRGDQGDWRGRGDDERGPGGGPSRVLPAEYIPPAARDNRWAGRPVVRGPASPVVVRVWRF